MGVPLAELAVLAGTPVPTAAPDPLVTGVTHDSRAVVAGDLYAGLPGGRFHGADFAGAARDSGAVAVLTDAGGAARAEGSGLPLLVAQDPRAVLGPVAAAVHGCPSEALLLLGVTGTNGKTTTTYLLEAGLRAAGHRTGLIGTVETRVGGDVVPSARTTPEATDLQALFARMRDGGVTGAAMEVSSHALALHRVTGTRFSVVAFTQLGRDHLDFHGDLESYYQAKASLFTPGYAAAGVVCVDDHAGRRLADEASIPVTTVSRAGNPADWQAEDVVLGAAGSRFLLHGPDHQRAEVAIELPGEFNVANAALAVVTLVRGGVPLEQAAAGVSSCAGVPGRMERIDAGQPFLALVDYAHTPDALATLLGTVRALTTGQVFLVVGAGGDRDRDKRPLMGAAAAAGADVVILTDDNPRSEEPHEILDALARGADGGHGEVVVEGNRARAIATAVQRAGAGDTVVVAGKGHEQGQEVEGVVRPFDDREVLRSAIQTRSSTCST